MDEAVGWLVAAGFTFFAFRYLFGASGAAPTGAGRRNVPQQAIDQVASMFPHLSPASIRYDLERNGANVQATVERALRDGSLPEPPAGFFAGDATPSTSSTPAVASTSATGTATPARQRTAATSSSPSLIERMGLKDRIAGSSSPGTSTTADEPTKKGWQATPEAREKALKEKKARMVLQARQRLLDKETKSSANNAAEE